MAINPQQTFANYVLTKIVPSLGGSSSASNLEWNAKKFLGQVPGESLDAATYAERTQSDLSAAAAAQPGNGEIASALNTLSERFGIAPVAAQVAGAPAPMSSGHSGGGVSSGGGSGHTASAESGATVAQATEAAQASGGDFDVNQFLSDKAGETDEELAWDTSVVDLLKLLGKDHSVAARRRYMDELGLDPSSAGSAEGNEDLRAALMDSLTASNGRWPSNLA